jgi:hypothetical protein
VSDADEMLKAAQTKGDQVKGQAMSQEKLDKAQGAISRQSAEEHQIEAASFTEETIKWLNTEWNDREFTPEQRIFSISLALVNFRNHFPEDKGGKEFFDKISKTAWEYFAANST